MENELLSAIMVEETRERLMQPWGKVLVKQHV